MSHDTPASLIQKIDAITLLTQNMARAVEFYKRLGFEVVHGNETAPFTSFRFPGGHLNLIGPGTTPQPAERSWARFIIYVSDVDEMHRRLIDAGFSPEFEPKDAPWGERYFHLKDPDVHELSFAKPL